MTTDFVSGRASVLFAAACVFVASTASAALSFTTTPRAISTTSCAEVIVLITGQSATASYSLKLEGVPSDAPVAFFSDQGCSMPVPAVTTSAGQGRFYVKATKDWYRYAAIRASVLINNAVAAAQQELLTGGTPPSALKFLGELPSPAKDECSGRVSVGLFDVNGFRVMDESATPIAVSLAQTSGTGVTFFQDPYCVNPTTGVPLLGSTATFSFRGSVAGPAQLTATSGTLTAATGGMTVGTTPTTTPRLAFASPSQVIPVSSAAHGLNGCSHEVRVELQTPAGAPSMGSSGALTVQLSARNGSSEISTFGFFADPQCVTPLTDNKVVIADGGTGASFYVRHQRTGPFMLVAAATLETGTLKAQQVVYIAPGCAKSLAFKMQPMTARNAAQAPLFKVVVQDQDGNITRPPAELNIALKQTDVATATGTLTGPLTPGRNYALFNNVVLTALDASALPLTGLNLIATVGDPNASALPAVESAPFALTVDGALGAPLTVIHSEEPAERCEEVTVDIQYADPTVASSEEVTVCVSESSATVVSTTFARKIDARCVSGTLNVKSTIVLRNAAAEQTKLTITGVSRTPTYHPLNWTDTGRYDAQCVRQPSVSLALTADKPSAMLGTRVIVDVHIAGMQGAAPEADVLKLEGSGLRLVSAETEGVTLSAGGDLRFSGALPEVVRVHAMMTGEVSAQAAAYDAAGEVVGRSAQLTVSVEPNGETANLGCSQSGGGLMLLALMVCALSLLRRAERARLRSLLGRRSPRTSRRSAPYL